MQDSRTRTLTSHLKGIDGKLYAERELGGMICVYRESTRGESFEHDGQRYVYPRSHPHLILALTHNWNVNGVPVEWGIEPILHRMQEIDLWNRGRTANELIESYEKSDQIRAKDRRNMYEAWSGDNRSVFKKAFKDINTSNMNVKESY